MSEHTYVDVIHGGAHTLALGVGPGKGILAEIVMTMLLVLSYIMCVVDERTRSPLAPLAVGFAVTAGTLAG